VKAKATYGSNFKSELVEIGDIKIGDIYRDKNLCPNCRQQMNEISIPQTGTTSTTNDGLERFQCPNCLSVVCMSRPVKTKRRSLVSA